MKMSVYNNKRFNYIELRDIKRSNCKSDKHINYSFNILVIKKGFMEIEISYKTYLLKENSIFILNPFEMHKCIGIISDDIEYFVISIDLDWFKSIQNDIFDGKFLLPIYKKIITDISLFNTLVKNCNSMIKQTESSLKQYHLFNICLITIIEEYSSNKIINQKDYLYIDKVLQYIQKNYKENIIVEDIINELNSSSYLLNTLFKKYFNSTPNKLIISYRLYRSKKLLLEKYEISYIARELGFYDQSHFHKHFKKSFEFTPKEYQDRQISL